jgi:gliding motility-associated-like protein
MKQILLVHFAFLFSFFVYQDARAQSSLCAGADPFCIVNQIGPDATFPASTGAGVAEPGNNYGCLGSQPNPAWYFVEMASNGAINIQASNSGNFDIDFALWGPFPSVATAINTCGSLPAPIDCSYSTAATEFINIPASAQTGQVYIMIITNFSNQPTTIRVEDIAGTVGTTSCTTTNPCSTVDAAPSSNSPVCTGGTLELYGNDLPGATDETYQWTGPNGFSSTQQNITIPNVTDANAGNYTLVVTSNGCISPPVTINIFAGQPAVNVNGTANVCPGGTITMIANTLVPPSASVVYEWTGPNGFFYSTNQFNNVQIPNATTAEEGTYQVTIIANGNCISAPDIFDVNVIDINPNATVLNPSCGLNNGNISLAPTGGAATYTYAWTPAATPPNTPTRTNLIAGTYTVTITSGGCSTTTSYTLTNNANLSISASGTPPACANTNTGSLTVAVPTGTYNYTWNTNPISNTQSVPNVPAGTYTVTVSSTSGSCSATASVVLTSPQAIVTSMSATPPSCVGGNTGTATVVASNGATPTYTYAWSTTPQQTTDVATGLTSGTYTVTVTNGGCSRTATVVVAPGAPFTASIAPIPPLCNGGNNGSATVNTVGGAAPFGYTWNTAPQQTAQTATNLSSGIAYVVTVTAAGGCLTTASVTLTNPAAMGANITANNPACNGGAGSATVAATGGNGVYSYNWSTTPAQNTQTATNLQAATLYTVTVTDGNGCSATANVTLTQPAPLVAQIIDSDNPTCFGLSDAYVTAAATGGTTPYTYAWNTVPAQNTITANNILSGAYTVTITDAGGCTATADVFIDQNTAVTATISAQTNLSCNAGTNASATVTAAGGIGNFNYVWNTVPPQNAATAINLAVGTYTVTVNDSAGCPSTASVTITQPTAVTGTTTNTSPSCFGNTNGTATVTPNGGSNTGYTFLWDTSPTQSTATANNLAATVVYTVVITDSNGCTGTATATLTDPVQLLVSISTNNATCGQSNGFATGTVTNGTAPYVYTWENNPSTSDQAIGYPAGSYNVTATDDNGCNATTSFNISNDGAPQLSLLSQTNTTCGQANGAASFDASGGQPPYSYAWSEFPGNITPAITNVSAGEYTLNISDSNNCSDIYTVTITDSQGATLTVTNQQNATCGQTNGAATITVNGGSAPFSYAWSSGGYTIPNPITLSANTYTVTVTDAIGCTTTTSLTITQSAAITISTPTVTNASCGQANGSINLVASGGNGLFSYTWLPNVGISGTLNNLNAGTYNVTVSDTQGCSATSSAVVGSNASPTIAIVTTSNANCGQANGSITLSASGGSGAGYTYAWFPNVSTSNTATNVAAASYNVTVTDSNGCTDTETINITNSSGPTLAAPTVVQPNCGSNTGSITFAPIAGVTYTWAGSASTTNTATALGAGTYTLTVSDANGCSDTELVTLANSLAPNLSVTSTTNESCGNANGNIAVSVSGGTGVITYTWIGTNSTGSTATNLAAGTYTVNVSDSNGCTDSEIIALSNAAAPTLTIQSVGDATCGQSTGSISTNIVGGSGSNTYIWSPNVSSSASAVGLAAGIYNITVTDGSGCSSTAQATVGNIAGVVVDFATPTNTTCNNNNGQIEISASGGTTPYNYAWSHDLQLNNAIATLLDDGIYSVTVTDANNCTVEQTLVLTDTPGATLSAGTVVDATCNASNGSLQVITTGGTSPINYLWSTTPAQNTATATNLAAGSYTATVTDANACTETITLAVGNVGAPTITVNSVTDATCTAANGSINVSASGGTGVLSYAWSNGIADTDGSVANLLPNTYAVTVSDATGCQAVETITINDTPAPTLAVSTILADNCGQGNGFVTVTPSGGIPNYTYSWNTIPPQSSASASNLLAGNYIVTVTDGNTCTNTLAVTINNSNAPTATLVGVPTDAACGAANGSATIQANGGAGNYSYDWSFALSNDNAASLNTLPAGSYVVTVTDGNNCSATVDVVINNSNGPAIDNTVVVEASCSQSNGSITVSISGGATPYNYTWSNNAGNNTPTAANLAPGNYVVTVTDANGCSITQGNDIILLPAPTITVDLLTPATCGLDNGAITISATNAGASPSFVWSNAAITQNISNLACGTYEVTVTDAGGCTATQTATVVCQGGITNVDGTVQNTTCGLANGEITVTATGTGLTYTWNDATLSTDNPTNVAAGSYTVTITDATACTQTAEFDVLTSTPITLTEGTITNANCGQTNGSAAVTVANATNPVSYTWSTTPAQTAATATNLAAGTYTVTATDANTCSATLSVAVDNADGPNASTTNGTAACATPEGSVSADATGGATPYSFAWNTIPAQATQTATNLLPGSYTVTVTDASGCTATATATVVGSIPPTVVSCGEPNTNSLTFDWTAVAGAVSYSVAVDGGAAQDVGNTTTFTVNGLSEGQEVSISVTVIGAAECGNSTAATQTCTTGVTVCDPVAFVLDNLATVYCLEDAPVALNITPAGGTWSGNGMADNTFSPATAGTGLATLTYNLTNGACVYDTTFTTNVAAVTASITASASSVTVGNAVSLTATASSTNGDIATYTWLPSTVICGDAACTTVSDNVVQTTTYTLTATDENGCVANAQQTVTAQPIGNLTLIPNSFSPNNDGTNDFFGVKGTNLQSIYMAVYNRWGQLVYEYEGAPSVGWNGEHDSKPCEIGTYVYYLKITYTDSKEETSKGNITLIR